jgi:TRAP-type C4-dicarboxylate transport system permease small subunit
MSSHAPAEEARGPAPPRSAGGRAALAVADASDRAVALVCRVALLVTGTALLVILSANVVARYALHSGGFSFAQELPERLFPWFIAAGVALAAQHGGHMSVEWLLERSGRHAQRLLILGGNLLVIIAYIALAWQALLVADIAAAERSPVLGLPNSHGYWAIAAACALLVLATAAISVRVALLGPGALPKPNPEEMPT